MGRVIRIDHLHREGVGNRIQQDTKQIHILGRKSCAQGCDERVLLVDCETDAAVIGVALPERGLTLLKELLPTPPMHRYAAGSDPVDDLTQPLPHPMRRAARKSAV